MPAFMLMFPMLMGGAGIGVDGGRYLVGRTQVENALQGAITTGAQAYIKEWTKETGGITEEKVLRAKGKSLGSIKTKVKRAVRIKIRKAFEANVGSGIAGDPNLRDITFEQATRNHTITLTADWQMDTWLLKLIGFDKFPATDVQSAATIRLTRKMTENEVDNIEVALVLSDMQDIPGGATMAMVLEGFYSILFAPSPKSPLKLATLEGHKSALVTIGLVPFANLVNTTRAQSLDWTKPDDIIDFNKVMANLKHSRLGIPASSFTSWDGCLMARTRDADYQVATGIGSKYALYHDINDAPPADWSFRIPPLWMELGHYCDANIFTVPLTNRPRDGEGKKVARVLGITDVYRRQMPRRYTVVASDPFVTFEKGQSVIQGLAWGWRMLSPRWRNLWDDALKNKPMTFGKARTNKVHKFLVVMAYNRPEMEIDPARAFSSSSIATGTNWRSANAYGAGIAVGYNSIVAVREGRDNIYGTPPLPSSPPILRSEQHLCFFLGGQNQKYYSNSIPSAGSWDPASTGSIQQKWFSIFYPVDNKVFEQYIMGVPLSNAKPGFINSVSGAGAPVGGLFTPNEGGFYQNCPDGRFRPDWENWKFCNPHKNHTNNCSHGGTLTLRQIQKEFDERLVEACRFIKTKGKNLIVTKDGSTEDAVSIILITINKPSKGMGATSGDHLRLSDGSTLASSCSVDHSIAVNGDRSLEANLTQAFIQAADIIRPIGPENISFH